jgi:hypothetical protein
VHRGPYLVGREGHRLVQAALDERCLVGIDPEVREREAEHLLNVPHQLDREGVEPPAEAARPTVAPPDLAQDPDMEPEARELARQRGDDRLLVVQLHQPGA